MRALRFVSAVGIAGLLAGPAYAADSGIYAGLSVGQSQVDISGIGSDLFDDNDTAFKILGGYRILDWVGVEVSYTDLGEVTQKQDLPTLSNYRLEAAGFNVYGVLFYEIANFDLFAKAGFMQTQVHERGVDNSFFFPFFFDQTDNTTDLAWGLGAQVRFGSLAARLEYERFEVDSSSVFDKPQFISLGVTWTFF
jgi:hypothetical protein